MIARNKEYWQHHIGSWVKPLKELLKSPYMNKLMEFIHIQYSMNDLVPYSSDLFKYFRNCDWDNLKIVVVVPSEASVSNRGKIKFEGIIKDHQYGPLQILVEYLEYIYREDFRLFNESLEHWGKQGILILPESLTYDVNNGSHAKQWSKFFRYVLDYIQRERTGIIFMCMGTDCSVNQELHYKYVGPSTEGALAGLYDFKAFFQDIDVRIYEMYGEKINWLS